MKNAEERAAFARKAEEARMKNVKAAELKDVQISEPKDYSFWFRIAVVIILLLFITTIFFFLNPAVEFVAWIATQVSISGKEIIGSIGTLIASFAGAWFAFSFARLQREKQRVDDEVTAGNLALVTLARMWNATKLYQRSVVDPHRDKPDVWLNLNVSQPLDVTLSFDMKALSFMMKVAGASAFQQIFLEEERYKLAGYLIEEHRRLLLTQAWPKMEAAGLQLKEPIPTAEMERIIGIGTVQQLKVMTSGIITNFDENVKSLRHAFTNLRTALKTIHPDRKFIDFKFGD
jgi:hypothetical protein